MCKKITVLGKRYTINPMPVENMAGNVGCVNVIGLTINVQDDLKEEQLNDTVLHEILHIISVELALDLSEADVTRLAVGLHSAGIKANV